MNEYINGETILDLLVNLLADQEEVNIQYEIENT